MPERDPWMSITMLEAAAEMAGIAVRVAPFPDSIPSGRCPVASAVSWDHGVPLVAVAYRPGAVGGAAVLAALAIALAHALVDSPGEPPVEDDAAGSLADAIVSWVSD
jgi:hypothetical protein